MTLLKSETMMMYVSRLLLILSLSVIRDYAFEFGNGIEDSCGVAQCSNVLNSASHLQSDPQLYCIALKEAQECLALSDCSSSDIKFLAFKLSVETLETTFNCSSFENVTTDEPATESTQKPTVPPEKCDPRLSNTTKVEELSTPDLVPTKESTRGLLCPQHHYPILRHCSLFSYSHLRAFGSNEFQTCSLPGKWYLLNHRDVTIEVTGTADKDAKTAFTKLDKVNITLHNHDCTRGAIINYVATAADENLPSSFSSNDYLKVKILDPIDFFVSEDRRVATILAPWLNLTIVVTKYQGLLGVVVRLPSDISYTTDGLCANLCPSHSVNSIEKFENQSCYLDSQSAIYGCAISADFATILNSKHETEPLTTPFVKICQFDVLRSLSYDALSFMKAIARQFILLPNIAPFIMPPNPIGGGGGGGSQTLPSSKPTPHAMSSAVQPKISPEPSIAATLVNQRTRPPSLTRTIMATPASTHQPTIDPISLGELPSSSGTLKPPAISVITFLVFSILLFLLYRC